MTDRKPSARLGPDQKQTIRQAREAAIGVALSGGVLLPELMRIVCAYGVPLDHRFQSDPAPFRERLAVSLDGLSFEVRARPPGELASSNTLWLWSRHTLRDGAQRWSVHLPPGLRRCWVGVADVRTRPPAGSKDAPQSLSAGSWAITRVYSTSELRCVPADVHRHIHKVVVFKRVADDFRSHPTVVLCTFDEEDHTFRMEIAGEPAAGVLIAPQMPAAEFLCPIVMLLDTEELAPGMVFAVESEDEARLDCPFLV
jgi:hypothetical protein